MEKIYDESQQKKKKKIKVDGVSMLCFAVAAFAIVSLIAVGFSGTSYAFPTSVTELDDNFTSTEGSELTPNDTSSSTGIPSLSYHYIKGSSTPLICLERDVEFLKDSAYAKTGENVSNDYGLLYLLAHLAPNASFTYPAKSSTVDFETQKTYADFWISQEAVWIYLDGTTNNVNTNYVAKNVYNITYVNVDDDSSTTAVSGKYFGYSDGSAKILDTVKSGDLTITELIAKAKTLKGFTYDIDISGEETLSEDENKQYYFSGPYTISSSISDNELGEFSSYTVKLENAPEGTVVTNMDGETLTTNSDGTFTSTDPTAKFYVRVTKDKVTSSTDITVTVNGTFKMFDGNKYSVSGKTAQTVTAVTFVNKTISKSTTFTVAPAPDTGLSVGVTIYFIGLIVLLCGVGIIYANAKPSTQN